MRNVLLLDSIDTGNTDSFRSSRPMGILVDANDCDVAARWQAVKDRLALANVDIARQPGSLPARSSMGCPRDGIPRVGVWLMPDNVAPGELERLR